MDQVRSGRFIAEERKKKGYTQKQLAEKLNISDKTISKWECGNGFPEVSLLLPLCEELGITVNDLLSGELVSGEDYQKKAEDNMVEKTVCVNAYPGRRIAGFLPYAADRGVCVYKCDPAERENRPDYHCMRDFCSRLHCCYGRAAEDRVLSVRKVRADLRAEVLGTYVRIQSDFKKTPEVSALRRVPQYPMAGYPVRLRREDRQ